jgi:hypothetical protein
VLSRAASCLMDTGESSSGVKVIGAVKDVWTRTSVRSLHRYSMVLKHRGEPSFLLNVSIGVLSDGIQ